MSQELSQLTYFRCRVVQCGSVEVSTAEIIFRFIKCKSCAGGTSQHRAFKYVASEESWWWKYTDAVGATRLVTAR